MEVGTLCKNFTFTVPFLAFIFLVSLVPKKKYLSFFTVHLKTMATNLRLNVNNLKDNIFLMKHNKTIQKPKANRITLKEKSKRNNSNRIHTKKR